MSTTGLIPETVEFDGIQVAIIRSPRRKTLALEINHKGVIARAPERMRLITIEKFIFSKRHWIRRHTGTFIPPPPPLRLCDGAIVLYQGKEYTLRVIVGQRAQVRLNQISNRLLVPISQSHLSAHQRTQNKLIKWYKRRAYAIFTERTHHFAHLMKIEPENGLVIKVRDYKRRWGCCDHNGQLSFNWRLIMAPPQILDYVVVHELAHRIEFNHSKRFWAIVAKQCHHWKDQQNWLHQNGASFYRF